MFNSLLKPIMVLAFGLVALVSAPASARSTTTFHCGDGNYHSVDCDDLGPLYAIGFCDGHCPGWCTLRCYTDGDLECSGNAC